MWALIIGAVIFGVICSCSDPDSYSSTSSYDEHEEQSERLFDKVYSDGSWRTKGLLSDYEYSDGKSSWVGFFGEEHRSNGEVVTSDGYVYKDGQHVGYEIEDFWGITHRYDKN